MSQDELAIRVIIDPTQFREELGRLRRDLEDQRRMDMDELRGGRREERADFPTYVTPPTTVEIREVVTDPEISRAIENLQQQVDDLERRTGLPGAFDRMTPRRIQVLLEEAMKSDAWKDVARETSERLQNVANELAARPYADLPTKQIIEDLGEVSAGAALLNLYDAIGRSGRAERLSEGRGAGRGLERISRAALRGAAIGPRISVSPRPGERGVFETIFHRVGKDFFADLMRELGKRTGQEITQRATGLTAIFDIFAPFEAELKGAAGQMGAAITAPEIKATQTLGGAVDQVSRQMILGMELLREQGVTLEDIARNPRVLGEFGEAGRLNIPVIALQGASSQDIESFEFQVQERVMAYFRAAWGQLGDPTREINLQTQLETAFRERGIESPLRILSDDLQFVIMRAITESEGMEPSARVAFVKTRWEAFMGTEEGEEMLREITTWVNPTFRVGAMEDLRAKYKAAGERVASMVQRGEPRERIEETVRSVVSAGTEQHGAWASLYALRDTVGGGGMGGLPPVGRGRITSRVGGRPAGERIISRRIVDPGFVSGLTDLMIQEEPPTEAEVEQVTRLVDADRGIEETPVTLTPEDDLFRRRALEDALVEFEMEPERPERPVAPERPEFVTTGVPMEYDPKEYLAGMKKVARGMGFKGAEGWGDFVGLVEAKSRGKLHEFLQEAVGSTLAVVGATLKRGAEAGVLSREQKQSLMSMLQETPIFRELYREVPSMDPITGEPEAISRNTFVNELVKQRIGPGDIVQMGKELRRMLRNPEINAMLNQKGLTGLYTAAIQLKRAERATMDLEPAFGGALDYWT